MLLESRFYCSRRYLCCSLGVRGCVMGPVVRVILVHVDGICDLFLYCYWCYCYGVRVAACESRLVRWCGGGVVVAVHCLVGTAGQGCWDELVCGYASPIFVCRVRCGSSCLIFHLDCVVWW